jgi:hypothetical protein
MQPYQMRAVAELKDLRDRRQKLANAINDTADFRQFPNAEQERMKRQHRIMLEYEQVLSERVAYFQGRQP